MMQTVIEQNAVIPDRAAEDIANSIQQSVAEKGSCVLALSGGSSPIGMLEHLSQKAVTWNNVTLLLVDERWTQEVQSQNYRIIQNFVHNIAPPKPGYVSLLQKPDFSDNLNTCNALANKMPDVIDIVVLGMGLDGHTASLFPDADEFQMAMETDQRYVAVTPKTAPFPRISMSLSWIATAKHIIIYIPGSEKLNCFEQIISNPNSPSPINKLTQCAGEKLTVYSSKD